MVRLVKAIINKRLVPIRLMRAKVWINYRLSSTYYCHPIEFKFAKENQETVQLIKQAIEAQIEALQSSKLQEINVTHHC